jgi:hypothetical protein
MKIGQEVAPPMLAVMAAQHISDQPARMGMS